MKKFFIFYILTIIILTFCLAQPKQFNESEIISKEELDEYRQSLITSYREEGVYITRGELEKEVNEYKEKVINENRYKYEGKDYKSSLKTSFIISSLIYGFIFLFFFSRNTLHNEIFGYDRKENRFGIFSIFNIFDRWL